jgi:DNA-binding CsgD family transcriptional regulator
MIGHIRCARLVGRSNELSFLRDRCREARLGRGSLVLVSGEAGIGKTRLVEELVVRAAAFGMHFAKSFALEHARTPLGPLVDLVRTLHAHDPSIVAGAPNVRRILARLAPELDAHAALETEALSARSQCAAVAHWSDVSTLEFFKYVAAKLADMHVVVLVVTRTPVLNTPLFSPVMAELRRLRAGAVLDLEPLSPANMQTFFGEALGTHKLPDAVMRSVRDLADGNPLFAEELLASAIAQPGHAQLLPATIRAMFEERVRLLESEDREILIEAAVVGRRFDPAFLAALMKRPLERILLALRHARALQLVVEDDEPVDGVVFRHALVRETLYASILNAEARGMHGRILRELEALPDRERRAAALAYHSWSAGEIEPALTYNELAGDEALTQLAANEAAVFYERALGHAQRSSEREMQLQIKLGRAYSAAGWSRRAIELYERAYNAARRLDNRELRSRICRSISGEYGFRGEGAAAITWQMAAIEAVAADGPSCALFAAQATAALGFAWRGEPEKTREYVGELEPYAHRLPSDACRDLADARAYLSIYDGRPAEALATYGRYVSDTLAAGDTGGAVRAYINLADTARVVGDIALVRESLDSALRIADEIVVPLTRPVLLIDLAYLNVESGHFAIAQRYLSQAEDAFAGLDTPRYQSQLIRLGLLLARVYDDILLDARYADERTVEYAFLSREPWWIGAIVRAFTERSARLGRTAEAERLITRAFAALPTIVRCHELAITAAAWGADADLPRARAGLERWAQIAASDYAHAVTGLFDAYVERRAGGSPLALGRRAARRFQLLDLPLWAAEAYEVAGDRAEALDLYLQMGSTGDIARLTAKRLVGLERVQLTKREAEVLSLVVRGHSNRTIAENLVLSERTVESHIRAILAKIGGRSRHDIVKIAEQHSLRNV